MPVTCTHLDQIRRVAANLVCHQCVELGATWVARAQTG